MHEFVAVCNLTSANLVRVIMTVSDEHYVEGCIMTKETRMEETSKVKNLTFTCKFCERSKPLNEMVIMTKFFPSIVLCRDCEKKMD